MCLGWIEDMITKELDRLESEAIYIMREVASEAEKPVMLYSIGKDSSVMLRLAEKAFYPEPIPFPLMHIDTGWKFKEMISFRNRIAQKHHQKLFSEAFGTGPAWRPNQ